jgi:hypothetical protein
MTAATHRLIHPARVEVLRDPADKLRVSAAVAIGQSNSSSRQLSSCCEPITCARLHAWVTGLQQIRLQVWSCVVNCLCNCAAVHCLQALSVFQTTFSMTTLCV